VIEIKPHKHVVGSGFENKNCRSINYIGFVLSKFDRRRETD